MTFRVRFYADQAFLSMISRTIQNSYKYTEEELEKYQAEEAAMCIILCQAALESFLNTFARDETKIDRSTFQEKNITDKINLLYEHSGIQPDWTNGALQGISMLRISRNWLIHFKDTNIGLINSNGNWIADSVNKIPKIDDNKELKIATVKKYYKQVRKVMFTITKLYNKEDLYQYLIDEKYETYLIG